MYQLHMDDVIGCMAYQVPLSTCVYTHKNNEAIILHCPVHQKHVSIYTYARSVYMYVDGQMHAEVHVVSVVVLCEYIHVHVSTLTAVYKIDSPTDIFCW